MLNAAQNGRTRRQVAHGNAQHEVEACAFCWAGTRSGQLVVTTLPSADRCTRRLSPGAPHSPVPASGAAPLARRHVLGLELMLSAESSFFSSLNTNKQLSEMFSLHSSSFCGHGARPPAQPSCRRATAVLGASAAVGGPLLHSPAPTALLLGNRAPQITTRNSVCFPMSCIETSKHPVSPPRPTAVAVTAVGIAKWAE